MKPTIYLGTLGSSSEPLKQAIISHLESNYEVLDLNQDTKANDSIGFALATKMQSQPNTLGIGLCGNGFGICKDSNVLSDIMAITCITPEQAMSGRAVNQARILCLGSRMVSFEEANTIIHAFFNTNNQ